MTQNKYCISCGMEFLRLTSARHWWKRFWCSCCTIIYVLLYTVMAKISQFLVKCNTPRLKSIVYHQSRWVIWKQLNYCFLSAKILNWCLSSDVIMALTSCDFWCAVLEYGKCVQQSNETTPVSKLLHIFK